MAMASSSIVWYPHCVCTSMDDRKQVCVGCVWIHPSGYRPLSNCASKISSSFSAWTVSLVPFCLGIISVEISNTSASTTSRPARIPQLSIFRPVFTRARYRNSSSRPLLTWISLSRPLSNRVVSSAGPLDMTEGGGGGGGGGGVGGGGGNGAEGGWASAEGGERKSQQDPLGATDLGSIHPTSMGCGGRVGPIEGLGRGGGG
mmetsp:Transcript_11514/g.20779  ORF Transcript_11514/g.20779 Transcript_11514/m.20779 type:complete len:202 (-) Transcript_11514:1359-1964(-)